MKKYEFTKSRSRFKARKRIVPLKRPACSSRLSPEFPKQFFLGNLFERTTPHIWHCCRNLYLLGIAREQVFILARICRSPYSLRLEASILTAIVVVQITHGRSRGRAAVGNFAYAMRKNRKTSFTVRAVRFLE